MHRLYLNVDHHLHEANDLNAYPWWVPQYTRSQLSQTLGVHSVLWIKNQISEIWFPWVLATEETELAKRVISDFNVIPLSDTVQFIKIGLLVGGRPGKWFLADQKEAFLAKVKIAANAMRRSGYCVLPNVMPHAYSAVVKKYMESVQPLLQHDTQTEKRLGLGNLALFATIHPQLTHLIQEVVDTPVKKSYCYAVTYTKGAILPRHTDRPQCVFNASIVFDTDNTAPWPIYVDVAGTEHEVLAHPGEVIVYSGTTVPHWRNELPSEFCTACFFHWVPQSFTGSLN